MPPGGHNRRDLTSAQARQVAAWRDEGVSWQKCAERLGMSDASTLIAKARRAGVFRPVNRHYAPGDCETIADPLCAGRVCQKCGRAAWHWAYVNSRLGRPVLAQEPDPLVRIGGRWLCEKCAPKRRPPTEFEGDWGDPPEPYECCLLE